MRQQGSCDDVLTHVHTVLLAYALHNTTVQDSERAKVIAHAYLMKLDPAMHRAAVDDAVERMLISLACSNYDDREMITTNYNAIKYRLVVKLLVEWDRFERMSDIHAQLAAFASCGATQES
jgi:hypothetical protein